MGRIKTIFMKRVGRDLFEASPERFSSDYSENKRQVREMADISSKKMLNSITGYITSLKKQKSV